MPSEIAIGGHIGWLRGLDSTTSDFAAHIPRRHVRCPPEAGPAELIGEAFAVRRSRIGTVAPWARNTGVAGLRCGRQVVGGS